MKRSGPPERRTPLRSGAALSRSKPLPARSAKRAAADRQTAALRALVSSRRCLLAGVGFVPNEAGGWSSIKPCAGPGTPHHLHKQGAQGPTTAENLVPLCSFHNRWVEDEPELARLIGLVVRPGIDHAEALRRRTAARLG